MKNFELISRYLNNEMTLEEKARFEKELYKNTQLKKEFELYGNVEKFIAEKDDVEQFSKIVSDSIKGHEKTDSKGIVKMLMSKPFAAVASVIILLGMSLFFIIETPFSLSNEELFNKYYSTYEYADVNRSDINQEELTTMTKAIQAYNNKEYQFSVELFNDVIETEENNVIARFLLAISYIETDNTGESIEILEEISNDEENMISETSDWYLALIYIKANKTAEAKKILRKLSKYENYYQKEALDLLGKL